LHGVLRKISPRAALCIFAVAGLFQWAGCGVAPVPPAADRQDERHAERSEPYRHASEAENAERYDLGRDELRGGHTLEKHVARTDDQLRERLERERNISAASTWTDRDTAEQVIAEALRRDGGRLENWMHRGERRPNLALHYEAGRSIGRSLRRSDSQTMDCTQAVIVLRAAGSDNFYVLTAYPETRR